MRTFANIALGLVVGSMAAWLAVHRKAVAAYVKGEPLPEPPEWHKAWHPCMKG